MTRELKQITCVEDDRDIRAVVEIVLGKVAGFDMQMCASGAEAVERAPSFNPDLILLDVMMPGMDGRETFRHLKQHPSLMRTPVVFMTAKAQVHEVAGYKELGAVDVVTKPFDPISLPETLRAIWARCQ